MELFNPTLGRARRVNHPNKVLPNNRKPAGPKRSLIRWHKPTTPAICEYEYAEMSDAAAPKAVSDEPLYDDVS